MALAIRFACAAALLGLTLACTSAGADGGTGVPQRKPGHWKLTSISAELGMTTVDACITSADSIAAPQSGRTCTTPVVERADDQVIVNLSCTSKLGEERISTLFTGDFQTWYRGITKITFDPAPASQSNMAVTVDAKFIGPTCPDGSAPH